MTKFLKRAVLVIAAFSLLSACSASFQEEQKATSEAVQEVFKSEPKKTNKSNDAIEYYLPFGYEIVEESENNILFKNGAKEYILFYNPFEGPDSSIVYDATVEQQGGYDVNEQFEQKDKLGFLLIEPQDKKMNKLVVGIGGVKITANLKTKSMKNEAKAMMEIANSVKIK